LSVVACCVQHLSGADPSAHALTISVDNVSNSKGVVGVLVFRSAQGWPEENGRAFRAVDVPAQPGQVTIVIAGLPDGVYGVVVLHDENKNQRLDRNWFGKPKEQWGMSNNPTARLSAPTFERARFMLEGDKTIEVLLH
jgi:uncharacterized protein (DUF2141 family)